MDVKSWLRKYEGKATLLGICPMAEEIILATLREASKSSFPPMFVASPRQVDATRGYTGWSQQELVQLIQLVAEKYDTQYLVARDHGGPYQSFRDRGKLGVSWKEAIGYAKEIFQEDLASSFDIIHIDATEDPSKKLEIETIAKRTANLISYCESLGNVYYEVGSEEVAGGLTEPERFEDFIKLLERKLIERGNEKALKKLLFIVGQVGTQMKIGRPNQFNSERAKELAEIASQKNIFLKVHYTDWLDSSSLQKFPKLGIGAANVGPEFSSSIIKGLVELEKKESVSTPPDVEHSSITKIIERKSVKESPWQQYAPSDVNKKFAKTNSREIALCTGRYVMKKPAVVRARQKLYENLEKYTSLDPEQFLIERVKESIYRYVEAFNLAGTAISF